MQYGIQSSGIIGAEKFFAPKMPKLPDVLLFVDVSDGGRRSNSIYLREDALAIFQLSTVSNVAQRNFC